MSDVQQFYDEHADGEWSRGDRHRTEFAVTLRALREFLPPPPARLLDVGGGPGRYAITLGQQGYSVTLVDLSPISLALAQEKARQAHVTLQDTICANALDLSLVASAHYDGVLLMGPLYHLLAAEERAQAVREARRVLKPQGWLFATFITRFAPFRDAAQGYPEWILEDPPHMERVLATGILDHPKNFTSAYLARPDEIIPLMESAGFETLTMIGCEGVVAGHEERINALSGPAWERWVDLNYRLGKDPALRGAADHLLYVGKRVGA
jgi:SAM-dependent methyltransferase